MEDIFYKNMEALLDNLDDNKKAWLLRKLYMQINAPHGKKFLDKIDLENAELWLFNYSQLASNPAIKFSRLKIWLIFMLLRYAALRQREIFAIRPADFDMNEGIVWIPGPQKREIPLPPIVNSRIRNIFLQNNFSFEYSLKCDPSQLKRSLTKCAVACGLEPQLLSGRSLRNNRIYELRMLGFGDDLIKTFLGDIRNKNKHYQENTRLLRNSIQADPPNKTSARNLFRGFVTHIERKGILVEIKLIIAKSISISAVITETSYKNLEIYHGKILSAIIKAPFIKVFSPNYIDQSLEENKIPGVVTSINKDNFAEEIIVELPTGHKSCSIYPNETSPDPGVSLNSDVFICFSSFSVILTE